MKRIILLVNCYRDKANEKIKGYHEWLRAGAADAGVDLAVHDAYDRGPLPGTAEFAAVIVSGSQKMAGAGEAEAALVSFLRSNRLPLLGICYGHQVLARAWGSLVRKDVEKHGSDEEVVLNKTDPLFFTFPPIFRMSESHEEIVVRDNALEREFMVLAENRSGLVEAVKHRERPLYGVQFHPEKSGELGIRLLVNFLNLIK
jgi:GMP synthase-like glutamine amidotransferase